MADRRVLNPEGVRSAVSRVLSCTWQRRRAHFMRSALAHGGKTQRQVVSAFVGTSFGQDKEASAKTQRRQVADQVRPASQDHRLHGPG